MHLSTCFFAVQVWWGHSVQLNPSLRQIHSCDDVRQKWNNADKHFEYKMNVLDCYSKLMILLTMLLTRTPFSILYAMQSNADLLLVTVAVTLWHADRLSIWQYLTSSLNQQWIWWSTRPNIIVKVYCWYLSTKVKLVYSFL